MPDQAALAPHPRDNEPAPVRRNPDGTPFDDLDKLVIESGITIGDMRRAHQCQGCGRSNYNPDTDSLDLDTGPCSHGCCTVDRCTECGHYSSGAGPAGCPCNDGI